MLVTYWLIWFREGTYRYGYTLGSTIDQAQYHLKLQLNPEGLAYKAFTVSCVTIDITTGRKLV